LVEEKQFIQTISTTIQLLLKLSFKK